MGRKSWAKLSYHERYARASHAAVCRWQPPPEPPPPVPQHLPEAIAIIEQALDAAGNDYAAGYYRRFFGEMLKWLRRVNPPSP